MAARLAQQVRRGAADPGQLGRGQRREAQGHGGAHTLVGGDALHGEQRRVHQEQRLQDEHGDAVSRGAARAHEKGPQADEQALVELDHGHQEEQATERAAACSGSATLSRQQPSSIAEALSA